MILETQNREGKPHDGPRRLLGVLPGQNMGSFQAKSSNTLELRRWIWESEVTKVASVCNMYVCNRCVCVYNRCVCVCKRERERGREKSVLDV